MRHTLNRLLFFRLTLGQKLDFHIERAPVAVLWLVIGALYVTVGWVIWNFARLSN
jgi:hypothetical protein